jgi:hypothetical protein
MIRTLKGAVLGSLLNPWLLEFVRDVMARIAR